MEGKPIVMITFREGGENGGPYVSHKRIMESSLRRDYTFVSLVIPRGRIGVLNIKLLIKLRNQIRETQPDIVHFTGLQLEGFHVALACKLAGIKNTVLAIHGSSLEAIEFSNWKRQRLNVLEILTLKMSRVCYGVSQYVCSWDRVKEYANWCYGCIYNMSSGNKTVVNTEQSFRDEIGVSRDDILVVSTGRITREKGFDVLLEVITNFDMPQNVYFVIAGDGEYFPELERQIRHRNLTNSVFLLGYRSDIDRILSESDIFILCTLHETLCNSIIEAGYYSLPTVATAVGGIPEIVTNGVSGYLVQTGDVEGMISALSRLVTNESLRSTMGKNAKEIIDRKFSSERIVCQINDLYRSIL